MRRTPNPHEDSDWGDVDCGAARQAGQHVGWSEGYCAAMVDVITWLRSPDERDKDLERLFPGASEDVFVNSESWADAIDRLRRGQ